MISEFALIDSFLARFQRAKAVLGPGDDCAVVKVRGELCVTTDALVQGVHFNDAFSPEDIGHKALAVNLSDLAAMGAKPVWFLCAIAMPRETSPRFLDRLADGMAALARAHRVSLVGGNFTAASELSITITAAGEVAPGKALLRSGGRDGDLLYVSGALGDALLGFERFGGKGRNPLAVRQRRPTPRIALGRIAARFASAAVDLSDGLGQDLGHLCRASKVGARIELEALPVSPAATRAVGRARALEAAARGGEDYELLVAIPPRRARAFEAACAKAGERVTRIGALVRGSGVSLVTASGRAGPAPAGYDHFG